MSDETRRMSPFRDSKGNQIYEGDTVIVENTPDDEPSGSCDVETTCIFDDHGWNLEDKAGGYWSRQLFYQQHRLTRIDQKPLPDLGKGFDAKD